MSNTKLLENSKQSEGGPVKKISTEEDKLSGKERKLHIYIPILLILITAAITSWIGVIFQDRSFRKNELFKAKLDRIMSQQEEVIEIRRIVDEARRQIRSNEDFISEQIKKQPDLAGQTAAREYYLNKKPMASSVAVLKESKIRLDALAVSAKTFGGNNPVTESVNKFSTTLDTFLKCLENNKDFRNNCSDEHPDLVESVSNIIIAHNQLADELIKEFE